MQNSFCLQFSNSSIFFGSSLFYRRFGVYQWQVVMRLTSLDGQIMASFMVTAHIWRNWWQRKWFSRFYIFPATTFSKVSRQLARFLSIYFTRGTNLLEEKESCNNVNGCKSPSLALLFLNEESSPIIPEEWFEALGYPKVLPTNIWEKAFFYIFWHLMNTHMIRVYG